MATMDLNLLEALSSSFGPSGHEVEPLRLVKQAAEPYTDEFLTTGLQSLVFTKKGRAEAPRVLIAGHADEIGFVVSGMEKGFLTFWQLGGWWDQTLLSTRVIVRTSKGDLIDGIICAKPPHIVDPEERKSVVTKDKMYIDVGCTSNEELKELGIRMGDPVVPHSEFQILNRKRIKKSENGGETETQEVQLALGKAFDNRVGCFIALEVLKRLGSDHPNTYYGAATTQEEVGLRGARTTAGLVQPDVAFALDVDISGDVPGVPPTKAPTKMSAGVSIVTYDGSMIPNPRLLEFAVQTAEENNIEYQFSHLRGGGTDAGVFQFTGVGCPSLTLNVSTRHIHSPYGYIDLADVEATINLCVAMLKKLDAATVQSFTEI
ncbi:MAG: M42 family peptidase [Gemmatimonadetes bacterium]|nr:MAG: M42 family peptidase [Gemmatimonadota bacterium]